MPLRTPVLFLIFNRPETTDRVFEAIREAQPNYLFIAADGPRDAVASDRKQCEEARRIVAKVDWECSVKTLFQETNLGCFYGPATAIRWFFENVEQGILLEDDCLPDQSFFCYCEELLNHYHDDERIFSINGCNMGYSGCTASYCFTTFMNMWGWATWRRVVDLIDFDLLYLKRLKFRKLWLYRKLNADNLLKMDLVWIQYWDDKISSLLNGLDTWDYRWILNQLDHGGFSIVPFKNMVTNIGFGVNSTHTDDPNHPAARINLDSMDFPLTHPSEIKNDIRYLDEIVKIAWCYRYKRVVLGNLLSKMHLKRPLVKVLDILTSR